MKSKKAPLIALTALIILTATAYAASDLTYSAFSSGNVHAGFRIPRGGTVTVKIDEQGVCENVKTVLPGHDLFVPTNSYSEWVDHFISNVSRNIANITSCAPSCTYAWSSTQTVCSNPDNTPPYSPLNTSGICDASETGSYLTVKQTADASCNVDTPALGNHTHYEYQVCTATCGGPAPVNGTCGGAATGYSSASSFPAGSYCSAGTANPSTPSDPPQGGSSTWTCQGQNGGSDISCRATRATPTYSWDTMSNTCTAPGTLTSGSCDATKLGMVLSGSVSSVPLSCPSNQPSFTYQICQQH